MSKHINIKFINLLTQKINKGFTLIELLIVVIIIGILAAIAMPNLLRQVAKGRQAEAKNHLSVFNRAQQSYRLENGSFGLLSELPVHATGRYYHFLDGSGTANSRGSDQWATALPLYSYDILDYTSAVGQTSNGVYNAIICEQTTDPGANDINLPTWIDGNTLCGSNSKVIK